MTTQELLDKRIRDINNELSYLNTLISKKAALELELTDLMASKIEYDTLVTENTSLKLKAEKEI